MPEETTTATEPTTPKTESPERTLSKLHTQKTKAAKVVTDTGAKLTTAQENHDKAQKVFADLQTQYDATLAVLAKA